MTNVLITPVASKSKLATTLASSTALRTINGGVNYRSSGMTDTEIAGMTKAMRDHQRMMDFATWFDMPSADACVAAAPVANASAERGTIEDWWSHWLTLCHDEAQEVPGTWSDAVLASLEAGDPIDLFEVLKQHVLNSAAPSHSHNNN